VATPVGSVVARLIRAGYPEATARRIASGELSMDAANKMARMQEQGFTIPQYHGTYSSDVFEVDPNLVDLGLHSGTPEQATQRLRDTADPFSKTYGDFGYREEANIMPLVIRAQRPLEMRDVGDWMNSSQVLEGLIGNPRLARRRQELESLYEEAGTLQEQFEGGEEFFRDSPENREILDEIKNILNEEGYDSIRYENQVENAYGAQSALRATAEQQRRELSDQISLIENAAMERAPQPPDPDDPLVKEKMRVFLDASRRPSDYMTPEEASRLEELKDRYRAIGSDPANYNDTFSYISLNPANVRSQFAAFDPEQTGSSNILAGLGGAGVVGAGLMAPEEAVASPLDRPEDAERRANARAVAVASDTLERLRRERGPSVSPLDDTGVYRFGAYLTENRPSEMDPVQRALQSLGQFQGIGEYLRTVGEGQRTTTMQDINAALDIVPL
jgi:hypothetical protein